MAVESSGEVLAMPLAIAQTGRHVRFFAVDAGHGLRGRLAAMGVIRGAEITVIRKALYGVYLIGIVIIAMGSGIDPAYADSQSGWRHAEEMDRLYDPRTVRTVSGIVVRLKKVVSAESMTHGIHLILDTDDGMLNVHLGPVRFIDKLGWKIKTGDQVEIEGSSIEFEGKPCLIAATIRSGEDVYKLRDPAGVPFWAGWRKVSSDIGSPAKCVLEGVVLDSSGASIPDATVFLEPGHESASTQRDGAYCFMTVDPATRHMRVTAAGFEERTSDIRLSEGKPTQVNFVLPPAVARETIYVTAATRTLKSLEEAPIRTEVILPDIIGLSASRNLAEAVEFNTGLRVENNCQNCNFSQIRMLGLQGAYTQILFDGQPTMSSLAQVYGIEQIPSRMVERIEVVKGGGSAIYGPGSVAGVVNVIPRAPSKTGGYLLGLLGWTNGLPTQSYSGSADWISADRTSTLTVFGQLDKVNPVDVDTDGYTEVCKRDFRASGARYRQYLLNQKAELTLDFNYIHEDRRGGDKLNLPPDQANIAEAVNSRRSAGGVSWHHTLSSKFDYRLNLSLAHTKRDTYYGSGMDPNAYGQSRNPLWIFDSQFNHFVSSHLLSWGGQVASDGVQDIQPAYNREYDETYRNVGLYIQDDWFFLPGLELVYGARIDKHSEIKQAIVSPRIALMWSAKKNISFRTSVATGFLPPQVFDEDLHITQVGGEGQIIRNAEDLKEEGSTSFTAGVEWKPRWGRGTGLIEFNFFRTGLRRLFNVVEDDDPRTSEAEFTRINFGKAKVYGAEINFGYALIDELELQAGYVEQRSRFNTAEPDFGSPDFFRTPNRYGLATLIYRNPKLVDFFLGARFTGRMKLPHYAGYIPQNRLDTSPSYWTLDASVSKSFRLGSDSKVVVTLGGKNLADYYQNDLDKGPNRDAGYVWGPRFPRTLYVSTSVGF